MSDLNHPTSELETDSSAGPDYIVGIGASAGGLQAIEQFFDHMPPDTGMAFVVVQHLSPDFKSLMDELLARRTNMPIHRVEDAMPLEANGVYLIPPKKNMILSEGKLLLTEQDQTSGLNLPIDIFFRSMALDLGEQAIAVVLSGTGSDGSRGIAEVHQAGGWVVVQDPSTASFGGMPQNAIATGEVDVVCAPRQMPERILEYVENQGEYPDQESPRKNVSPFEEIFSLFRERFGLDFSYYKTSTTHRRAERRMSLSRCDTMTEYLELIKSDEKELEALYRDLLVEVTSFFRDPEAYELLESDVIPDLFENLDDTSEFRCWVPGCATGEEAYSIAMLLHQHAEQQQLNLDIKVFATDVHQKSLEIASSGCYSKESVKDVPLKLLERYFQPSHHGVYQVSPELRQIVIFAPHDITRDAPFTRINFLSCRNVLIYFDSQVQRKVLSFFHFSLKTRGVLFLGPSETVSDFGREFQNIDTHWRIYRKLRDTRLAEGVTLPRSTPPRILPMATGRPPAAHPSGTRQAPPLLVPEAFEMLLSKYVPPSLLVNERHELIHSFGEARKLLVPPEGKATLDVLRMVTGNLRMALSAALHQAAKNQTRVVFKDVKIADKSDQESHFKVVVEPMATGEERMFLISLEESHREPLEFEEEEELEPFDVKGQTSERLTILERELKYTKESLQTTVEELETSNEELQSTNEELVAANEELQSTNEELHSVNEELYTVNAEHQRKIDELVELTTDMDYLLRSTQIGMIFLDQNLCIRKYSPATKSVFNLLDRDEGRPLEHISHRLEYPDMLNDVIQTRKTGQKLEKRVYSKTGDYYLCVLRPYSVGTPGHEGVILTLADVTAIEKAHDEVKRYTEDLQNTNRELEQFAYAVSHDLQAPLRAVEQHCSILQEDLAEAITPDQSELLSQVSVSSRRMHNMIDGLLAYSRVNTRGQAPSSFDAGELVDEVTEELRERIDTSHSVITREMLPTLQGDRSQIKQVFHHLLENGIKYHRGESPKIHIASESQNDSWLFTVMDNGCGIPTEHFRRIFIIFQTLYEKEDELAGTGIGLAISKRIIERHHGKIWLESTVGKGSTFFFSLPKTQPHKSRVSSSD